ncbi:FHA domain-containing protein [Lignipirellula cremea]|uniref:FHA domain protein n=1 Tax=Lignipirellula cremea TaxID=2528010 RepID=A0A518DMI8_9BACT|nr:FHA domain-containing protein [Lignipirellula cremea]QDU93042.1 FHA domain protein [Lignipirellula cremea]
MTDKISITHGELYSDQTERKLQQGSGGQLSQPYPTAPEQASRLPWTAVFYHSLVYMSLGGLLGGFSGWLLGEIVNTTTASQWRQFQPIAAELNLINERRDRGEITPAESFAMLAEIRVQHPQNVYLQIYDDRSLSARERERRMSSQRRDDQIRESVANLMWFLAIGMPIAFCLAVCEPLAAGNFSDGIRQGAVGLVVGLIGAAVVGLFIDRLYNFLQGPGTDPGMVRQMFARTVGWSMLGAFLAIGPGVAIRNGRRLLVGLLGGMVGGALGGYLFDPVATVTQTDILSRLVGVTGVGLFTGLGAGILENVARHGWLKVQVGLIAGKQFVLYHNPTIIGSSPQCEIYLFKDPAVFPRHAAIFTGAGGYDLKELDPAAVILVNGQPVRRVRLHSGDRVQIGGSIFEFQERNAS